MSDQSTLPGYQAARTGVEVESSLAKADTSIQPDDLAVPTGDAQADGLMSHEDKAKLDGIESHATTDQTAQEIAAAIDADATAEATLKSALALNHVANQTQQVLHGFPNRTASTIAFDNTERVFTLGVATTATIYIGGAPYTIASPGLTIDLDTKTLSVGLWYLWAEVSGAAPVLNASKSPWSITDIAAIPVATVYWNGSAGALCDERHSANRNLSSHAWQHATVGARIANDGSFAQTYPTAAQSKLELIAGYLWDEDLITEITAAKGKLVRNWYETASGVWSFADGTNNSGNDRPYIWNAGTSRVRHPKSDNSYTLTDCASNLYLPVWVYATNDATRPIYIVTPAVTAGYSLVNARNTTPPSLPFAPEMKLLWRWIFSGAGTYQEAVDYRGSSTLPGGGVTAPAAVSVSFAPTPNNLATNVQQAITDVSDDAAFLLSRFAAGL